MSDETGAATKQRKRTTRSPQYPAFGLRLALERAREIYQREQFHRINYKTAITDMGLSPSGSTGIRALSALLQFGILEESGSGDGRQVQFSAEAKKILVDDRETSPERDGYVRTLARKPAIYADLLNQYGPRLPSDAEVTLWLVTDKGYNRDSVGDLIASFKDTVSFAKLDTDGGGAQVGDEAGEDKKSAPLPDPFAREDAPPAPGGTRGAAVGTAPHRKEPRMPAVDTTSSEAPWDLTLPLGGGTAILRVPQPLTAQNLQLLRRWVDMNLKFQQEILESLHKDDGA